jgi:hypothetical protein
MDTYQVASELSGILAEFFTVDKTELCDGIVSSIGDCVPLVYTPPGSLQIKGKEGRLTHKVEFRRGSSDEYGLSPAVVVSYTRYW